MGTVTGSRNETETTNSLEPGPGTLHWNQNLDQWVFWPWGLGTVQDLYNFHLFQMVLHCWLIISLLPMLVKQPTDACFISPKHFVFSTTLNTAIWCDWRVDASESAAVLINWDRICHHITLYFRWNVSLHLFYKSCLQLCYKCKLTFQ